MSLQFLDVVFGIFTTNNFLLRFLGHLNLQLMRWPSNTPELISKARVATSASAGKMYPEDSPILIDPIALSLAEDNRVAKCRKATEFQYSAVVPRLWAIGNR
jgi:hypothetical protein